MSEVPDIDKDKEKKWHQKKKIYIYGLRAIVGELSICADEFLMLGSNREHEIQKLSVTFYYPSMLRQKQVYVTTKSCLGMC